MSAQTRIKSQRQIADALRSNPGQWAKWPQPLTERTRNGSGIFAYASMIRTGKWKNFPRGEFEAVVRNRELYVRAVSQ